MRELKTRNYAPMLPMLNVKIIMIKHHVIDMFFTHVDKQFLIYSSIGYSALGYCRRNDTHRILEIIKKKLKSTFEHHVSLKIRLIIIWSMCFQNIDGRTSHKQLIYCYFCDARSKYKFYYYFTELKCSRLGFIFQEFLIFFHKSEEIQRD